MVFKRIFIKENKKSRKKIYNSSKSSFTKKLFHKLLILLFFVPHSQNHTTARNRSANLMNISDIDISIPKYFVIYFSSPVPARPLRGWNPIQSSSQPLVKYTLKTVITINIINLTYIATCYKSERIEKKCEYGMKYNYDGANNFHSKFPFTH